MNAVKTEASGKTVRGKALFKIRRPPPTTERAPCWTDVLTSAPGDATEAEIRDMIAGLNEDERHDLIALVYIGRGDLEPEEWGAAVRLAREREDASRLSTSDWLLGIPNLADLLDEGLAAMGRSCT